MNASIYERSQHTVSRKNIDTDALKIMHRLIRKGFKAYLVGGGVRDLLLEKKPKDFDIATDATPKQIKSLFRNCRIIGKRFKLAHIFFKDQKIIEVSTFRDKASENISTLSKDNIYGTEVTDVTRRDLTINALYYDLKTFSIIDYVGGFKDLQKKVIRLIGNANDKVVEDPVRMWRAIRHAAKCDFKIEPESKKAILENINLIKQIPIMRMHDELKKDFCSGFSYEIFKLAQKYNILDLLLPELTGQDTSLQNKDNETSMALQFVDNWIKRGVSIPLTSALTVLTVSIKKSIEKNKFYNEIFVDDQDIDNFVKTLFTKFFVPKKEKEQIVMAIKLWRRIIDKGAKEISVKALSRRVALDELKLLVWFTRNDEEIINKINEAIKAKENYKGSKTKEKSNSKFKDKKEPKTEKEESKNKKDDSAFKKTKKQQSNKTNNEDKTLEKDTKKKQPQAKKEEKKAKKENKVNENNEKQPQEKENTPKKLDQEKASKKATNANTKPKN